MPRILLALTVASLVASACAGDTAGSSTTLPQSTTATTLAVATTTTINAPLSRPPFCDLRWEPEPVGTVASIELDEISGATISRRHQGVIWLHNDSGDDAAVYAAHIDGTDLGRVSLPDLSARDWEDMALGPGPDPTLDYLYLADIGDNRASRDEVLIHRIPEPEPGSSVLPGGETLRFTYPLGPTEAETLLVDPVTGDMVIAGKALSGVTRLFGIPGDVDWSIPHQATFLGEIALGTFALATGGDAGVDRILIRTYDEVFSWERLPGQSLAATLLTPACRLADVDEAQGEAIALAPDERSFYTVSEGLNQPIYRFGDES